MTNQTWSPERIGDLTGRTAYITGGNSGIGWETALVLARHGARVVLAGRSRAKLDEAAHGLRAAVRNAAVETSLLDLGSLASIRTTAAHVAATETIDWLFNNAGVMNVPDRRTTTDGFELTFGTNHLGHFALTAGLLPALLRAEAPRVITVSAIAGTWRSGRLTDLQSTRRYSAMAAYAKSKRANIVFAQELARRGSGTKLTSIAVHPGSALTNLQRHSTGPISRLVIALTRRAVMGTPEGAAWPSLYAATSPDVVNGGFYGPAANNQTAGTPKPVALPKDADDAGRLWEESERLTDTKYDL
ncbi:SDR family NAD(P)-dependent oxidoreductase [Kribbella sandramycini]|uniref:NAD(P)-dependent dehydrogenase (Short-subunit alcohol dehydrogenase family) n=1 Tax=Kribbella sandramycini TaxID=60450 RepID=A0A7Y4L1P7_9ACTN|nr:NAD(P)-dependent dehydrogenase (short-subunit alcohol dehydrogenase family) [Kribbella sandramycini]NOL42715.1 SDR family NAD(P)-dependent oxidoreductase [Kribbella sandramycini]